MKSSEPVLGIDLGTSNTIAAVVYNGQAMVIPDKEGNRIQPSVVAFLANGGALVGPAAKARAPFDPQNTIYSVKRLIGRSFFSGEVQQARDMCAFTIAKGQGDNPVVVCHGRSYAIPEICGFVLRHVKAQAEAYLGCSVKEAVITVPANFNDSQRQSTRLAGEVAGLQVLRILNEPTAAALAYGLDKQVNGKVAVYDFGGGTFDVTILDISGRVFHVLATGGDTFLGGDDFDLRLVHHMVQAFEMSHQLSISNNQVVIQRLKAIAEKVKCELTFRSKVSVHVQELVAGPKGPLDLAFSVTREGFAQKCRDIVQQTYPVCDQVLYDAKVTAAQVERLVLVGGTTRMPLVRDSVERYFSRTAETGVNPDEVVAIGAAIYASSLKQEGARSTGVFGSSAFKKASQAAANKEPEAEVPLLKLVSSQDMPHVGHDNRALLLDVTPKTLGVATVGGYFDVLIERNTPVPVEQSRLFTTSSDNQTTVRVQVYQGESRFAEENTKLGELELYGLRPAMRGEVGIEVTFIIDTDGIVSVKAKDQETQQEQQARIKVHAGFTDEQADDILNRYKDAQE